MKYNLKGETIMRKKLTVTLGVLFIISCITMLASAEVKMEFAANSDFGGVQGANGWLYEYSTDGGNTYKELDVYSNACWTTKKADGTGNENWGICSANWNLTSHDVILATTFYAPYSGVVTVGSTNGIVAPSSADIEYRLTYNGTPIKDWQTFPKGTTQWAYYNDLAPVEVTEGDKIRYEIRLAQNEDSLKQCWHIPKVTYKKIYEDINNPYFSTNTMTVKPGAAKKISIITPDDTEEKAKGIVSANPELVSVFQLDNSWYVQGLNAGDATINLLSDSGEIFDQCTVTVSSQIVTEADITKITYNSNSDFSNIQGSPFRYQYSENGKDFYDFDLLDDEGRQWAKENQWGGHDWNYPFIQGNHLYLIAGGPSCSELFIAPFSGIISFNTASEWSASESDSIKIQRNGEQIFPAPGVEYRPTVQSWFKLGSMDVTAGDEIRVIFDRTDPNAGNGEIWYQYTMNCQNGTFQSDGTVKNTASIDTEVIKLIDGETIDVPLTILSRNGEKENFKLTSSDSSVASVAQEDGVWRISANSTGRAVLSVVGENSGVTDTCEICVFDSSGIIVDEFALVPDTDKVSARIAVQIDGSSLQAEAQLIIAGYDSDNKLQCIVPNHQIYENNGIYKTDMILPNENIKTVKAFLWDGFETLNPITKTQVGDIETLQFSRISPDDPAIAYIGRWTGDSNGYTSGWARPYFKVDFTGTSLRINLTTKTNLAVTIDGQESKISNAQGMVVLAEGLSEGTHHARVTTASYNGVISLKELFVDAGEKCITPELNSKHIEFIGDSITAAEGGYSWMLGEELGLEHNRVCYPGIALTDGTGYYSINNIAPLFRWGMESAYLQSTMPGTGSYNLWDTKKLIPDFIVVNLGTNDNVSGSGTREIERFGKAYERLLNTLRTAYPNAEIFVLEMVSVSSSDKDARQETIKNTVETMGDSKIHYVPTRDWNAEISGDNIHPTQNGHRTITNKLKEILQSYL